MPKRQRRLWLWSTLILIIGLVGTAYAQNKEDLLGLPALEVPKDNPITKEKVTLGEILFNDTRFSTTGKVSCATCHDAGKGFSDGLKTSKGINDLTGTRNAPTVLNAAFNRLQFWDGRSPTLENQSTLPLINSIEHGLKDHQPVLDIVRSDAKYAELFKAAFPKIETKRLSMTEVSQAIASFERTLINANSRFDRWYYRDEKTLNETEIKGFQVFVGNGRCVSCHQVEHTTSLFTDHVFHNIGVGINRVPTEELNKIASSFLNARATQAQVDEAVLKDPKVSELGRFAITKEFSDMGGFKTSTLRNINLTAPYMHDGSLATLEDVVEHYNRGGASSDKETINAFISGGIRPLNLTNDEKKQLVAFMKTLTSQKFEKK